jgi:hypothetical protein
MRSEKEVDEMIEAMASRTKGKYITQGVSFNKTCPRQMGLLKKALMSSVSFSGLAKELLAMRFSENGVVAEANPIIKPQSQVKNIGNFL